MKKVIRKIRVWFVWLFEKRVREAINNGASYEEVEQLVSDIVGKEDENK